MSKKPDTLQNKNPSNPIASRLQEISSEFDKMVTSEHHQSESSEMKKKKLVQKRDGSYQPVSFDKISERISNFSEDLDESVDPIELAQEVISCIYDKIQTKELDELAARKAHNRCFIHPDWDRLAARISISNHHKETIGVFSEVIFELHRNKLVNDTVCDFVKTHEHQLNDVVDYTRDFALDYTGFQYFLKTYADRTIEFDANGNEIQGPIVERFQDMLMKVSLGIHRDDLESAIETYQYWSCLLFTHATPTIFSAHKDKSQCSSCFLIAMKEEEDWPHDSIDKIYETLSDCAKISKLAGGIGLSVSNVRAKGTIIHSVSRPSSGIIPMLKVFNMTANYVDQGRRRKGAFSIFLEPWHPDIIDFLQLKKDDGGAEDFRAKDLFYALWIPDLFMKRVEKDEVWSLIDPMVCPELYKTNGEEFEKHYLQCEKEKKYATQMPARKLLYEIVVAQIETGTPYMCFKDHSNVKSNQKNLGTIRSSNLCVSGDTRILTNHGYEQIKKLQDQKVTIWNGFEWSDVTVIQTGKNQEMMKISFSNGATLKCTPYHKFYLNISQYTGKTHKEAFVSTKHTRMARAQDLNINDKLIKYDEPNGLNGDEFVKVTKIEYLTKTEDTYCFTEEKLGLGIFEGIATGQCSEIVQYSDSFETGVCNLSSLCLHRFLDVDKDGKNVFNHKLLYEATKILVRNLNKVIDINYYPNEETKNSNFKHRPVGIGIQGLADTFFKLRYPFESPEAAQLNSEIAETIYFAALEASCELAEEDGPYDSYEGSPISQGIFQFDMWPAPENRPVTTNRWNWDELRANVKRFGVRNSLLVALMPTASTSFLMGSAESFEPLTSNYYNSGAAVGTFKRVNKYLIHDMIERGLWTAEMRNAIIANNGSVLNVPGIPEDIQKLYKTVWEISQKVLIDLSAERGRFTCQSQSLNQYLVGDKNDSSIVGKLSSLHMYAWKKGLKTGMYYLRTQAAKDPIKTTIDPSLMKKTQLQNMQTREKEKEEKDENEEKEKENEVDEEEEDAKAICRRDNKEDCLMCGS